MSQAVPLRLIRFFFWFCVCMCMCVLFCIVVGWAQGRVDTVVCVWVLFTSVWASNVDADDRHWVSIQ